MITEKQKLLAMKFKEMHNDDKMFILPNVWNAGSAYVFEMEGFEAVATSSAGVSYALGFPDGEDISIDELVFCVEQITNRIDIPLSVDFERGYGENIEQIKDNAKRLLYHGTVGFNIEDGRAEGTLDELSYIVEKIKALVELKKEIGLDFIINARTDAYWLNIGDSEEMLKIALERGSAFKDAGADSVFIPGGMDEVVIKKLVEGIDSPLNVILNPVFHDFQKLEKLGVRRLSIGSGPARSVFNHLKYLANELMDGKVDTMLNHSFNYGKANEYFIK